MHNLTENRPARPAFVPLFVPHNKHNNNNNNLKKRKKNGTLGRDSAETRYMRAQAQAPDKYTTFAMGLLRNGPSMFPASRPAFLSHQKNHQKRRTQ